MLKKKNTFICSKIASSNSLFKILTIAAIFVAVVIPHNAFTQKKPSVIRLVVSTPPNDYPLGYSLNEIAKKFNERAKGEYAMEIHAGGALAKLPEYFDAVRIGAVEMASVAWSIFAFLDPKFGIMEAPFLFNNQESAVYATKGLSQLYDTLLQEKFNAKGLGLFAFTSSEVVTTKPVKSLKDMKGLLIGAISPVTSIECKDLSASPVTIMWYDMYESLQKRVVDGTIFNIHAAKVMNLFDICKHATISFGPASLQGLSINLDVWNKMPKHIKKILQEEADTSNAWLNKNFHKLIKEEISELSKKGVSFYYLSPEERQKWVNATAEYREKQLNGFGDFGMRIKKIAEVANNKYPYKGTGY